MKHLVTVVAVALALTGCGLKPAPMGATVTAQTVAAKADHAKLVDKLMRGLEDRSFKARGYTWSVLFTEPGDMEVKFTAKGNLLAFTAEGLMLTDNDQQGGTASATGMFDPASGAVTQLKLKLVSIDF
jgi:hypothetical protein